MQRAHTHTYGRDKLLGVLGARTPTALHLRAPDVRRHIIATVVRRAPQVMVNVAGGGRGMGPITAHLRYISKNGRLPFEDDQGVDREGKQALRDVADQWRLGSGRIPETSARREAPQDWEVMIEHVTTSSAAPGRPLADHGRTVGKALRRCSTGGPPAG